ncbi:MAG: hypothetical protein O0X93_01685 [Methanocorpusculum sp.]|nr:hypothetical protein [Methanocorpusculum sp.]MDE2521856.1 hypothetical protein [Methanocorpusculum sp.]MDE2524849.1 hypothetical protein [Methanocorpusculum sp.]
MGRQPNNPEEIVTTVHANRFLYNLALQRGASPSELFEMALAAYLEIDLEQEVRYESILRMKKRLQERDLVGMRKKHADLEQRKLAVYTQIEEENQLRERIAKCMLQAVSDDKFREKISRDVELRQWDSTYLENIVATLHSAVLQDLPEDKIRECVMATIRNNWAPVLLEAT